MILKCIMCLMVIGVMEKSKQVSTESNAGQQAKCSFQRGSGEAYLSVPFGQEPESRKGLNYLLTQGRKFLKAFQQRAKALRPKLAYQVQGSVRRPVWPKRSEQALGKE